MTTTEKRLTILMVGVLDSRHVEHLAIALARRGHVVHLAGEVTGDRPRADLAAEGIESEVLNPRPSIVPGLRAIRRVRALRRVIAATRPDIVHAHYVWYWGFFALAAGAKPLVVSAWGSDLLRATGRARLLNRIVVKRAALVLADSAALLDAAQELGARRDRTAIVNWGVDLDLFAPAGDKEAARRRLGLEPEGHLILAPRELTPLYNPRLILDAFAVVCQQLPDARLVFKHQGFERPDLEPIPCSERVMFVGDAPYESLPDYFRAADVCVSVPSSDSSPRTVWEAMASGCPCVLSDLPWVHELITPDRDALVVPIQPEPIGGAILALIEKPALAESVRAAARRLVEQHRGQEAEMAKLVGLYTRAIVRTTGSV